MKISNSDNKQNLILDKIVYQSDFTDRLNDNTKPVLVFDGATGTSLQNLELTANQFGGYKYEGCNENLVLSCPEAVIEVHRQFLEVGSDVIETNTFGASSIVLAEYGLEEKAYIINRKAAEIASTIANEFSTKSKKRFVAGSIGPTTKLPTLGHITFDELVTSYEVQVAGLLDGGVDLLLVETCQDVLQIKTALSAIENIFSKKQKRVPIMVSVTMETTGSMLIGTDISAVLTILEPYGIEILGLNCATGPEQMKEHIKYLSLFSPFAISCIPNAGLPENIGGVAHYRLKPIELKINLMNFIKDLGVRVIGGCCGTTPEHIKELVRLAESINENNEVRPNRNNKQGYLPSASSLYTSTNYSQDNSFLIVGERLNASGSKKVRELLNKEEWDGLVSLAKGQVNENAHILDVNVDYVGRNGEEDMKELVSRLVTNVNLPLMLDSTEYTKMESGLKVAGGKCLLNSTNYEDGYERFKKVMDLAKKYGAGVVIGTIDEKGMARTSAHKLSIALRAFKDATNLGISPSEIFYDPLALPISTGIEEDRLNAFETIKAIKSISSQLKDVHIILGISNISFGLSQAARITLNSVFLNECCKVGLDAAIISPSKILPLSKIKKKELDICLDLIYDKRKYKDDVCIYDPLSELTKLFEGISTSQIRNSTKDLSKIPLEERLRLHIIDGERIGIEETLKLALKKYKPLDIINKHLLEGMKVVGDLFGSGQMQLPFVLQSAETMKSAVAYLEPFMDKEGESKQAKGIFLIATVKGDVHDIGKNLVDIILTNNGYEVINLGIKQEVSEIIKAQKRYNPDCIAMSGLLVKSTAFMKENLEEFNKNQITVPVILGGAALTPKFVNVDCNSTYNGLVIYGKDAFTDLRFMDCYMKARKHNKWDNLRGFLEINENNLPFNKKSIVNQNTQKSLSDTNSNFKDTTITTSSSSNTTRSNVVEEEIAISPNFLGNKVFSSSELDIDKIIFYLDKQALFAGQWQMRRLKNQSKEQYTQFLEEKAEPILEYWLKLIQTDNLLDPKAVYGYFPCGREGNNICIFDKDGATLLGKFNFPRQKGGNRYCIADYYRDLENNQPKDFIPMQAVTMGSKASDYAQHLFQSDSYSDYLFFHGLAVQMAEALAEYIHSIIRIESGFKEFEPAENRQILAQKYRGCRFSFGYPACPDVSNSRKQLEWLEAHKVGLTIDDSDQLHPEQSTTALIALHSKARYFTA